jgi:quercetin dioxygenase-like cupin family protein
MMCKTPTDVDMTRSVSRQRHRPIATSRAPTVLMFVATVIAIGLAGSSAPPRAATHREPASETLDARADTFAFNAAAGGGVENAATHPGTINKVVSCNRLPHVPGKSITTVLVDFPPAAYSPAHRHPGSVTAYVLSGTIRSQLDGGAVGSFTQGQTFFEPPGTLHNFAENASDTEPAQLLATFVADSDCGPLTIPER